MCNDYTRRRTPQDRDWDSRCQTDGLHPRPLPRPSRGRYVMVQGFPFGQAVASERRRNLGGDWLRDPVCGIVGGMAIPGANGQGGVALAEGPGELWPGSGAGPDWRALYEREREQAEAAGARAEELRWAEVRARCDAGYWKSRWGASRRRLREVVAATREARRAARDRPGVAARGGASARSAAGGGGVRGEAQHGDGVADGGGAPAQEGPGAGEGARCPRGRGADVEAADQTPGRPVGGASRVAYGAAEGEGRRRERKAGAAALEAAAGPAARGAGPWSHGAWSTPRQIVNGGLHCVNRR